MAHMLNRRVFLKRSGTIAAMAGAAGTIATHAGATAPLLRSASVQLLPRDGGPLRVLLLHDPAFPTIDCDPFPVELLRRAFADTELRITDATGFAAALKPEEFDLVVTAHGSAFPEAAGMPLLGFLARGCNWLQLGGVPLAVPVRRGPSGWETTPRRTRWHRKLGLTQAFAVDCRDVQTWEASRRVPELTADATSVDCRMAFALYWRLASTKYFPHEDGSAGTRDGDLQALLLGFDGTGKHVHGSGEDGDTVLGNAMREDDGAAGRDGAIPAVACVQQVDWSHGDYAGGRWVMYTGDRALTPELISRLAALAGCGSTSLDAAPGYARYRPGELPAVRLRLHRPRRAGECTCTIEVLRQGNLVQRETVPLRWSEALSSAEAELLVDRILLSPTPGGGKPPGGGRPRWYDIRVSASIPCAGGLSTVETWSGFFVADDDALAAGSAIGRSGATLLLDGRPFAAAGTTYMAGDVQRNFLLEPNPWVWRADFRAMRAAGINLLRTGIWYGWKRMMLEPGRIDEGVLRAMDAFMLVAIEQDIPVIFSFFAFLPEAWGGENPYLDPRAVEAQKTFVAQFARRYRHVPGLIWDLINEPSFSSPAQLWRCRPNYDRHEVEAWRSWLRRGLPDMDDAARLRVLVDRWRSDSGEIASLPTLADFDDANLFSDRQPLKVLDYRLFAQDAFAGWVRALSAAIHAVDRPDRMIMVGQDEGGTMDRPNPQFFADVVDITSVHSWWFNDDLLWDSIVTRAPGLPHLVQETGAMFYEQADGTPWRSEDESARLVERKLALAAGAGSAGFVQWLWNSNPYMPSDNEAAIGALRADGSGKPEFAVLRRLSHFLSGVAPSLDGRREEAVVLVLPHADQFSVRGNGTRATRASVRTMAYDCRVPLRAVSEYALERDHDTASLYLLPSPAVLSTEAWDQLLRRVALGAVLLVTGVLNRDEYWRHVPRSVLFHLQANAEPIAQAEVVEVDGTSWHTFFRGDDLQRIEKAVVSEGKGGKLLRARHGRGHVLWCPLPVEMGDNRQAIAAVYHAALREAGIEASCKVQPDLAGVLAWVSRYQETALLTVLSELSTDTRLRISLRDPDCTVVLELPKGRTVLLLIDQRGRILRRSDRA